MKPFLALKKIDSRLTAMSRICLFVLLSFVLIPAIGAAFGRGLDGTVDPNFLTGPGFAGKVWDIAKTDDGKLLVAGDFTSVVGVPLTGLAMLNSDGTIDFTFNPFGSGPNGPVYTIQLLPDGKILIGGDFTSYNGLTVGRLTRLFPNGEVDPTFYTGTGSNGKIYKILLQTNGQLIIGGTMSYFDGQFKPRLVRLFYDGALDPSYTYAGYYSISSSPYFFVQQPDGKILIGGRFTDFQDHNNIVRITTSGQLDPTFVTTTHGEVERILVLPNGKIVISGQFDLVNEVSKHGIAMLTDTGNIDPSFTFSAVSWVTHRVFMGPDGKFIISGSFDNGSSGIARRNSNGTVDGSFTPDAVGDDDEFNDIIFNEDGTMYLGGKFGARTVTAGAEPAGVRKTNYSGIQDLSFLTPSGAATEPYEVTLQRDGKIVFVLLNGRLGGVNVNGIGRLNPDGTADHSFTPSIRGTAMASLNDGSLMLGGVYLPGFGTHFMKHVFQDGTVDPNFELRITAPVNPISTVTILAMTTQEDGKVIVGGDFDSIGGTPVKSLTRLNPDGSIDATFVPNLSFVDGAIRTIRLDKSGKIWIGGDFKPSSNSPIVRAVLRLNSSGIAESYTPYRGEVDDIAPLPNQKAYICGDMLEIIGDPTRKSIARLNVDGSVDTSFITPVLSTNLLTPYIFTCNAEPSGKVVISGNFDHVNGVQRRRLARLNADGSLDLSFPDLPTNEFATSMKRLADGSLLIAGGFESVGGLKRYGFAKIFGPPTRSSSFDFDGDGKTDASVYRPSNNVWYLQRSTAGFTAYQFGAAGDKLAPADYTGDGKTDVAIYRPSTGTWYILRSEDLTLTVAPFGIATDIPTPGDFDGDGKADLAVYRPGAQGTFYIQRSTEGFTAVSFGLAEDRPTSGDFDGDGKTDIAVYRPSTGVWYRYNSSNGAFWAAQFGAAGDKVVPADYTGDGKTDIAVYRPSTGFWYVLRSENETAYGAPFGLSTDIPAAGDYDGDGKTDLAVFRPDAQGLFYILGTSAGFSVIPFGLAGDIPAPSAYVN